MSAYTAHEIFADEAADYLDKHNIYMLFNSLLKDLVINKPKDPLSHMIGQLEKPAELLKVIIIGAPGSGVDEQINKLVSKFGVVHIRVDSLLVQEIENKTPLGAKVQSFLSEGLPVSDEVTTHIVASRLQKSDCCTKGWVLNGYPTTAAQVHSLQMHGVMCTKLVILDCDTDLCKKRARDSGVFKEVKDEDFDGIFVDYERNLKQIVPLYPQEVTTFVDARPTDAEVVSEAIVKFCALPPVSKAPRRPMRVAMLGAVGAGKETQCVRMSNTHGLVHISTGNLLRKEMGKNAELKKELEPFFEAGALVSDDIVIPIVIRRLLKGDCRRRGWLLDGFPRTVKQGEALNKAHLAPNRVMFMDISQEASEGRCFARRVDPDTHHVYNLNSTTNPPTDEVKARLVQLNKDKNTVHKTLFISYASELEELKTMYEPVLKRINAVQPVAAVFEEIERFYLQSLGAKKFG